MKTFFSSGMLCILLLCASLAHSQPANQTVKIIFKAINAYTACVADANARVPIENEADLELITRNACADPRSTLIQLTPNDLIVREVDARLQSVFVGS